MFVSWNFSSCHAVEMKSQQLSCSSDEIATAFAEVSFWALTVHSQRRADNEQIKLLLRLKHRGNESDRASVKQTTEAQNYVSRITAKLVRLCLAPFCAKYWSNQCSVIYMELQKYLLIGPIYRKTTPDLAPGFGNYWFACHLSAWTWTN